MVKSLHKNLISWLSKQLKDNNKDGFVIGISGGVDSCVLTYLLETAKIPYVSYHYLFDHYEVNETNPVISYLKKNKKLNIEIKSLQECFQILYNKIYGNSTNDFEDYLFKSILKAKLAHIDLSQVASRNNYLVLGTINKDEFSLGYFVKNTCIGDLLPFADVPKKHIRDLGLFLGVDNKITKIKASGCVYGSNAEDEWGITEDEIYEFISGKELDNPKYQLFKTMLSNSSHKRIFPSIFINK